MKKVIGSIDPSHKSVTIVGAGFSGLVLGHYLKKAGFKVTEVGDVGPFHYVVQAVKQ